VNTDELLFVEEVAREVRAPVETVRWWIRTGKLPASKPGRRLLIRRSDLLRLLADREKPDSGEIPRGRRGAPKTELPRGR
jgi:excisionase family DNA binding protein